MRFDEEALFSFLKREVSCLKDKLKKGGNFERGNSSKKLVSDNQKLQEETAMDVFSPEKKVCDRSLNSSSQIF